WPIGDDAATPQGVYAVEPAREVRLDAKILRKTEIVFGHGSLHWKPIDARLQSAFLDAKQVKRRRTRYTQTQRATDAPNAIPQKHGIVGGCQQLKSALSKRHDRQTARTQLDVGDVADVELMRQRRDLREQVCREWAGYADGGALSRNIANLDIE